MKDLAPEITRVRLLIEGFYCGAMDEARVSGYLLGVTDALGLGAKAAAITVSRAGANPPFAHEIDR